MHAKYRLLALLLWLPLAVVAHDARSEDAASLPVVGGDIIRDSARITFEWPQPVMFKVEAKGKKVAITFERKANPDFGTLLSQLYPYVTSARRAQGGKTIILTLDKPYSIRTFVSDNIGGIELLKINPGARRQMKEMALAAMVPAAGEEKEAAPVADGAPAATPAAALAPAAPAPADNTATPSDAAGEAAAAMPEPAVSDAVKVNVSASEDSATLRLPFSERVAMSAFIRTNTLWIVFNKPIKLDLTDFDALPRTVVGKGELLSGAQVTVLRVPVEDNVYASVSKEQYSFDWSILLTSKRRAPAEPLKIGINTEPPALPYVFIPALEMAEPVTLHDPLIGDDLVVLPLFRVGQGIPIRREFVEFSLLKTAQGIAVAKKADDVTMLSVRDGVRVSMPQGAMLTPDLPEPPATLPAENLQSSATLFPYDAWKLDKTEGRRAKIHELLHKITESGNVREANESRLRLAQLYLSEGMAPEAIGLLETINSANPAYYRSAKLAALRGAADFLMYRFTEAARAFAASELNNNKEIDYWRSMLSDLLGNADKNFDYLELNADYISKYPPLFRQRLAIVAADRSIDAKEYNTALKIFDALHTDNLLDPINNYVNFLMAKISADTGQEQDALDMWDKLAEDYKHPFVQSRAEFSRIAWGMDHANLERDQVIDRLERLRLSWHGDGLELKILTLLGDLYAEKKDNVNAMRVWDAGVTSFPNSAAAISMGRKMEGTFVTMFNEGGADNLPTLDALALYYQYRNFAPPGNVGNQMIERLANRLAAVDLLDQTASLLDHQMHFQMEKEQRSRLGAKLATIHLLNHKPKKALQALEDSVYGDNQVTLRMLRNRLAAEALTELGQSDKALQIIAQDDSSDAGRVRLEVYWLEKDWPRLIAGVEEMMKNRRDVTAPITLEESEYLLQLALAYVFENNTVQLQYLHDYFGPLMASNPNKAMFDFITADDITPTPTNFNEVIKNLSQTRSFIENYKARIQTAGLDAVVPPVKATAKP